MTRLSSRILSSICIAVSLVFLAAQCFVAVCSTDVSNPVAADSGDGGGSSSSSSSDNLDTVLKDESDPKEDTSNSSGVSSENVTVLPQNLLDEIEDSFFDALSRDPSCHDDDCWAPPQSTVEVDETDTNPTCSSQPPETSEDGIDETAGECSSSPPVDKHWGSDPHILIMRDKLREAGSVASSNRVVKEVKDSKTKSTTSSIPKNRRPPVFLMPGLASTRLIAWKFKSCPQHPLLSDIKVLDIAWLNINLVFQMGTLEASCLKDCLSLGLNQTDTDDLESGCKLRPDEGLDAISSLSPGGIGSDLLVGGTNTGKMKVAGKSQSVFMALFVRCCYSRYISNSNNRLSTFVKSMPG